jgi:hypothetical protein
MIELTALFQIHTIPEEAQKELEALFEKSNLEAYRKGYHKGCDDRSYNQGYDRVYDAYPAKGRN